MGNKLPQKTLNDIHYKANIESLRATSVFIGSIIIGLSLIEITPLTFTISMIIAGVGSASINHYKYQSTYEELLSDATNNCSTIDLADKVESNYSAILGEIHHNSD